MNKAPQHVAIDNLTLVTDVATYGSVETVVSDPAFAAAAATVFTQDVSHDALTSQPSETASVRSPAPHAESSHPHEDGNQSPATPACHQGEARHHAQAKSLPVSSVVVEETELSHAEAKIGLEPDRPTRSRTSSLQKDDFRWPLRSDELYLREKTYFEHAGKKLFEASQQGLRVLAVTSARQGEGCTTLSVCLARAVAAAGGRVALLDADLHNPQLGRCLTARAQHANDFSTLSSEMTVLSPEGIAVFPHVPQQRASDTVEQLAEIPLWLRSLTRHFDLVVVDLGQLATAARDFIGSSNDCAADASIIVRDVRTTSQQSTLLVAAHMRSLGIQAVGIAENFRPPQSAVAAA